MEAVKPVHRFLVIHHNAEPPIFQIKIRACLKKSVKKVFRKMCVTIYGRFCPDEGIVAVLRVDRKSNIKKAICASLPRWLSSVILLLFTNFVNIHTVDHNIQDLRIGIFHADSSDVSHTLDRILNIFPHDTFSRLEASVRAGPCNEPELRHQQRMRFSLHRKILLRRRRYRRHFRWC